MLINEVPFNEEEEEEKIVALTVEHFIFPIIVRGYGLSPAHLGSTIGSYLRITLLMRYIMTLV